MRRRGLGLLRYVLGARGEKVRTCTGLCGIMRCFYGRHSNKGEIYGKIRGCIEHAFPSPPPSLPPPLDQRLEKDQACMMSPKGPFGLCPLGGSGRTGGARAWDEESQCRGRAWSEICTPSKECGSGGRGTLRRLPQPQRGWRESLEKENLGKGRRSWWENAT